MIGFLLGLIGYLCFVLMPDGKCPKCKKSYYDEMCEKGSNNLSRDVLPNIFTDDKGKIKTEYIATGLRKVFYKCPKCGHDWEETVQYKENTKM